MITSSFTNNELYSAEFQSFAYSDDRDRRKRRALRLVFYINCRIDSSSGKSSLLFSSSSTTLRVLFHPRKAGLLFI